MDIIDKLTEVFKQFPGIGERQARRFVYFLMSRNQSYKENLSLLISDLKREVAQCGECFRFFIMRGRGEKLCEICSGVNTDPATLMVLEKDSDLESVRKSGLYTGKYFILGGLVPIVERDTKRRIRIDELVKNISGNKSLKEIILAFSLNPQGEHTDSYVREQIKGAVESKNIKVASLGRGLSTGTELEYSDNDTLKNALKNRQ
jgi:recombination protein RecR